MPAQRSLSLTAICCGDRDWTDFSAILKTIAKYSPNLVIQGEARGADRMARDAAIALDIAQTPFPALWERYGRAAGPLRNQAMLDHLLKQPGKHLVLAFHDDLRSSIGTKDMVKRARKAKVHCINIKHRRK